MKDRPNYVLAVEIVTQLCDSTKPGNCTWGDEWTEAHSELFGMYYDDMVKGIETLLDNHEVEKMYKYD